LARLIRAIGRETGEGMASNYTENNLVEQPAIELFAELGWETANCFYETFGPKGQA